MVDNVLFICLVFNHRRGDQKFTMDKLFTSKSIFKSIFILNTLITSKNYPPTQKPQISKNVIGIAVAVVIV